MLSDENLRSFFNSVPSGIRIVAVSKTRTAEEIMKVYNSGQRIFGENRVQELMDKRPVLPADIEWHMIGHLQSNKVKYIAPYVSMIQSVDTLKLLGVIDREARVNQRTIDVLLQVFIAEEETKFGLSEQELHELLTSSEYKSFSNIKVRGLMGMATFTDDQIKIRREFHRLATIFHEIKDLYFQRYDYFSEVSMGMSGDFRIAIEEGSTMIRIGSLIFGNTD